MGRVFDIKIQLRIALTVFSGCHERSVRVDDHEAVPVVGEPLQVKQAIVDPVLGSQASVRWQRREGIRVLVSVRMRNF